MLSRACGRAVSVAHEVQERDAELETFRQQVEATSDLGCAWVWEVCGSTQGCAIATKKACKSNASNSIDAT